MSHVLVAIERIQKLRLKKFSRGSLALLGIMEPPEFDQAVAAGWFEPTTSKELPPPVYCLSDKAIDRPAILPDSVFGLPSRKCREHPVPDTSPVLLHGDVPDSWERASSPDRVIKTVEKYFGVGRKQFIGRDADKVLAPVWQVLVYLLARASPLKKSELVDQSARSVGTVTRAHQAVVDELNRNPEFRKIIAEFCEMLRA